MLIKPAILIAGSVRRKFARLLPPRQRYPIWSIRAITLTALLGMTISAALVFLIGKKPFFVEMELTGAIIATALFLFLLIGLYRGARIRRKDLPDATFKSISLPDTADRAGDCGTLPDVDCPLDTVDGDAGGCLGAIVAILFSIAALFALVFIAWALVNLGAAILPVMFLAICWVFHRALRQVFAKSRICRGKLGPSLGYALLYTGWFFVVVFIIHAVAVGPA
jgi:hypothetical protein